MKTIINKANVSKNTALKKAYNNLPMHYREDNYDPHNGIVYLGNSHADNKAIKKYEQQINRLSKKDRKLVTGSEDMLKIQK